MTLVASVVAALTLSGGLHGVVTRGPIVPVCRAGQPCSAPAVGVTLTFTRAGKSHIVKTGAKGLYRIALAPGTYSVRVTGGHFGLKPQLVVVPRARFALANFFLDTGIR